MDVYEIKEYIDAGCEEMEIPIMIAVHKETGGKVCDTGCHAFNDGRCKAYINLIKKRKAAPQPIETVRVEAKRRGISISEVRRQRRDLQNQLTGD